MSDPQALARIDPQALLSKAIETGAGIDALERLVALTKDVRAWTAKEAYNDAIADFQRRCPPIKKNKVMAVPGRPTYRYADLGEILSTIAPLMGELGLSQSWRSLVATKPNHISKVCVISHRLGHSEESGPTELPYNIEGARMNPAQSVGSADTYAKRYSLCSVLGISPEDDTDATGSDIGGRSDTHQGQRKSAPQDPRGAPRVGEPDHAPADPRPEPSHAPLFADPDQQKIMGECMAIINAKLAEKVLTMKDVREMKKTYLGAEDALLEHVDIAAVTDLRKYLAARFEKASSKK